MDSFVPLLPALLGQYPKDFPAQLLHTRYPWTAREEQAISPESVFFIFYLFIFWLHFTACGILVPWPGIEPGPTAVKAPSLNHWTAREIPRTSLEDKCCGKGGCRPPPGLKTQCPYFHQVPIPCVRFPPSTLYTQSYLILRGRRYCVHFTGEDTEVLERNYFAQGHTAKLVPFPLAQALQNESKKIILHAF